MHIRTITLGLLGAVGLVLGAALLTGRTPAGLIDEASQKGRALFPNLAATSTPVAKGGGGGAPQGPPPVVSVSPPVAREIIEWDVYTGRFDAIETVDVRARVGGYLTEVHFKDGQDVRKGDLLFIIDPRPFERALELAKAELNSAQVKVENSKLDVERGRPLLDRKIISEKVFDDRANVQRDAEAAAKVSDARVKAAELELSFTRITAPVSGRTSRTLVNAGNLVSGGAGQSATSLTSIVSQDPIHVYFDVNENNAVKYRRMADNGKRGEAAAAGSPVGVGLPDETAFPHQGRLDFIDNRLDAGTATLRARAVVDNKSGLFSPGMFARVRLAGSPRYNALMLPDEAIATDQASRFIYVVGEDQIPIRRAVKLGPVVDGLRVVREGVAEGEWVIVKGHQRVRPGQAVNPKREPIKVSDAPGNGAAKAPAPKPN